MAMTPRQFARGAARRFASLKNLLNGMAAEKDDAEMISALADFPSVLVEYLLDVQEHWLAVDFNNDSIAAACLQPCPSTPMCVEEKSLWKGGLGGNGQEQLASLQTLAGNELGQLTLRPGSLWWEHFNPAEMMAIWEARGNENCMKILLHCLLTLEKACVKS